MAAVVERAVANLDGANGEAHEDGDDRHDAASCGSAHVGVEHDSANLVAHSNLVAVDVADYAVVGIVAIVDDGGLDVAHASVVGERDDSALGRPSVDACVDSMHNLGASHSTPWQYRHTLMMTHQVMRSIRSAMPAMVAAEEWMQVEQCEGDEYHDPSLGQIHPSYSPRWNQIHLRPSCRLIRLPSLCPFRLGRRHWQRVAWPCGRDIRRKDFQLP